MRASLTFREAVASWVGRELGIKNRDLCARYDVDPRRLYEVWEEQSHRGSRETAERLFFVFFPLRTPIHGFECHEPKYQRTSRDQMSLF
jgi:hypothetical protein